MERCDDYEYEHDGMRKIVKMERNEVERCNGCEYEYDGLCTALGKECNEIGFCTVTTNRVKEEVSGIHTRRGKKK